MINFSELMWNPRRRAEPRPSAVSLVDSSEAARALAKIPSIKVEVTPEMRLAAISEPHGPAADRFRLLRMRLRELRTTVRVQSVLVTSPIPKDGKSTIALNLASMLAEGGKTSVLLIDADCHLPSQANTMKLERQKGVAECIESGLEPLSAIRKLNPLGLYFMDSGNPQGSPSDFFQTETFTQMMETLAGYFEWIVVDTPPVLALADALAIGRAADTSLLVTRVGQTPRNAVDEAVKLLGPKQIFGVVLNADDGPGQSKNLYSGYYRYGKSGKDAKK